MNQEKKKAQVWLNIFVDVTDVDTGEKTRIKLPFGLALDTMGDRAEVGSDDAKESIKLQNQLKADLLDDIYKSVQAGESVTLDTLGVEVYRCKPEPSIRKPIKFGRLV